jgi:hypothetical protein
MTDLTPHHIRPVETWVAVRDEYLAGLPAELVAERHGVSLSSVRTHARVEGWRRTDQPSSPPAPRDDPLTDADEELDPADMAELARRHAARAILRGRAVEAERWTRIAERWERTCAVYTQPSTAELDGFMRMARIAAAVSRHDPFAAGRIRAELRHGILGVFGARDDTLEPPAPALAVPSAPAPAPAAPRPGLHGLHGAQSAAAAARPATNEPSAAASLHGAQPPAAAAAAQPASTAPSPPPAGSARSARRRVRPRRSARHSRGPRARRGRSRGNCGASTQACKSRLAARNQIDLRFSWVGPHFSFTNLRSLRNPTLNVRQGRPRRMREAGGGWRRDRCEFC